jgi:uncharacterized protein
MFREMRRTKQLLSQEECIQILNRRTSGMLGVTGDDGYPYTVPLSYVYRDNRVFFHGAKEGHKIDGIRRNDKVSFCVIDQDLIVPEKFTTHFSSVILFGRARILEADSERQLGLELLNEKYAPDFLAAGLKEIEKDWGRVSVVEISIEHMTGKAAIEIVNKSQVPGG